MTKDDSGEDFGALLEEFEEGKDKAESRRRGQGPRPRDR